VPGRCHQLGTRAYALGDADTAINLLQQALQLRLDAGDAEGAANTRHNLEFIRRGGQPPPKTNGGGPNGGGWGARALVAGVVAVLAAGAAVAVVARGGDDPPPADSAPPTVTIASPKNGATFEAGATVKASFHCDDDVALATCTGTAGGDDVDKGDDLPNEPGPHTLTVRASDEAGNVTSASATYAVGPRRAPTGVPPAETAVPPAETTVPRPRRRCPRPRPPSRPQRPPSRPRRPPSRQET